MVERDDAEERLARIERELQHLDRETAEFKQHAAAADQRLARTPSGDASAVPDTTPAPISPTQSTRCGPDGAGR